MSELTFVPKYKVVYKKYDLDRERITIVLANLANDFDVIEIEVSKDVGNIVDYDDEYSINTRIRRTWYTLWLGKKEEHYVLGNVNEEGSILITTASLSDKAIEELQREWKKGSKDT